VYDFNENEIPFLIRYSVTVGKCAIQQPSPTSQAYMTAFTTNTIEGGINAHVVLTAACRRIASSLG